MSKRSAIYVVAIGSVLSFACAKQGTMPEPEAAENPELSAVNTPPSSVPPSEAETSTASVGTETSQPGTEPAAVTMPPPPPVAAVPETLTDDQIAKITETVDTGEVEQSKIAQKKAKSARVKKYASHMITQHNKSKKQIETLAKKAQITPADSTTAQDLSQKSTATIATLESTESSPDFDRKYIDAQVTQHESVVQLLDSKLIPSASNADLKARLEETRKLVETHLTEAKEIQSNLASAEPTARP